MSDFGKKIGSFNHLKLFLGVVFGLILGEIGTKIILPYIDLRQDVVIIASVAVDKTTVKAGGEFKLTVVRTKYLECTMQVVSYWENERGTIYHADVRAGYNIKPSKKNISMIVRVPETITAGTWKWFRTLQHECLVETKPTRFNPITFKVVT